MIMRQLIKTYFCFKKIKQNKNKTHTHTHREKGVNKAQKENRERAPTRKCVTHAGEKKKQKISLTDPLNEAARQHEAARESAREQESEHV